MKELIQYKYSGQFDNTFEYVDITVQTIAVLIGGIIFWRGVVVYQKRLQQQRRKNGFFDSKYSKHWKK